MIKTLRKLLPLLLACSILLALAACGSDDPQTSARLTIGIQRIDGTPADNIGSVALEMTLPAAFKLKTGADTMPTSTKSLVEGLLVKEGSSYVHPTLTIAMLKGDGTPFPAGKLVQFSRPLQGDEVLPAKGAFILNLTEVTEISGSGDVTIETGNYVATLKITEI